MKKYFYFGVAVLVSAAMIVSCKVKNNPSITWQLADANDEDACNALNN